MCHIKYACKKVKGVFRTTIDNSALRKYVAKLMLNWKDPMVECERAMLLPVVTDKHCPKPVSKSTNTCIQCVVCSLERSVQKIVEFKQLTHCDQSSNHMLTCINPNCDIIAHSHVSSTNKGLVFKIPQFVGLSCFNIAHHELSMGLFSTTSKNSCTVDIQTCSKRSQQQK